MNFPYFIAQRLIKGRKEETSFSRPINVIAIIGIATGLAVMILAVAILTGFKQEIRHKVVGFGSHIQIMNYDSNISFETTPISDTQSFVPKIKEIPGVKHIQVFATKAGIIKTDDDIQGVVLKGVGSDYDWSYFSSSIVDGSVFAVNDTSRSDKVIISKKISDMLRLKTGDSFAMHFVQDPPRMRKFTISGIYETSLEEFDKIYVFCDIGHIKRLNGWEETMVSGFEIFINDFDDLDAMTEKVEEAIGYRVSEEEARYKITSIRKKYPQIFDWLNFQDINVIIIIILMIVVAGFNMISGLLILILEKTNMIGILKALGSDDKSIRKVFLYQAAYLIGKGLLWGNLIGLGIAFLQLKTGLISLNPASYYIKTVPVNLELTHILLLNTGTMVAIIIMLLVPSQLISRITPVKAIRYD
ncbi:MAG: ABC transporter permease [Bacteroidetes bacterium GWE2_41_25]|nr:MAG: ABC transporter permease [Bacteroidetes bacterium GWA2_40_15]OFX97423.1 MAG: ABC transporter permease [Bacteroidetes bacterium GWC2_40_22]OFX98349.1 MAG: ABC transporter permease [Bacteroidetes bacterium GWE2_41_25]OFY59280.1 MAG: ABC transporter permease [Bacteroidetes bacterium GWF2_41_9]HAM11306.1 ABC transporter permease [Bacteroidales bacterium]